MHALPVHAGSNDDVAVIGRRMLAPLLEVPAAAEVRHVIDSVRPGGTFADVDYEDTGTANWLTTRHLAHIRVLAQAFRAPGSPWHEDPEVLRHVENALDHWFCEDYRNDNWWFNEIGVPRSLAPTLQLMSDYLTENRRAAGLAILSRAEPGMTGQNLVWVCEITARRGIIAGDPETVARAFSLIEREISLSDGEGIRADFSFHQHGPLLYSHGYGAGFVADCARIAALVRGTSFAFGREAIELLSSLVLDGHQWMCRGRAVDFGAKGREITRKHQSAAYLAPVAETMAELPTGRRTEFLELVARMNNPENRPLTGNRHFWKSDLMTHHRAGWYASARMYSTRVYNTDNPANDEGLKSHHIADGCMVLMRDGDEYYDIFPLWDWQKIPGTTVELTPDLSGDLRRFNDSDFVGGVSDGTIGMAAFDFGRHGLTTRKSWVFLDDQSVCLGAGIACLSDNPVITTLNQCYLSGSVRVEHERAREVLPHGRHIFHGTVEVFHDDITYELLSPSEVVIENDTRYGTWLDINPMYDEEQVAGEVFTCWLNHGSNPRGEQYAYRVVPHPDGTENSDNEPPADIVILSNTEKQQAVWCPESGVTAIAWYEAGRLTRDDGLTVGVDRPCLMLLREEGDTMYVSLADPRNRPGNIVVELSPPKEGMAGPLGNGGTRMVCTLPGGRYAGSSVTVRVPGG